MSKTSKRRADRVSARLRARGRLPVDLNGNDPENNQETPNNQSATNTKQPQDNQAQPHTNTADTPETNTKKKENAAADEKKDDQIGSENEENE